MDFRSTFCCICRNSLYILSATYKSNDLKFIQKVRGPGTQSENLLIGSEGTARILKGEKNKTEIYRQKAE